MAFVEGTMEKIFINLNYPEIDLVPVVNGSSWTTESLCKQIISKYRAKKSFPSQIVIWLDREGNKESCEQMASTFKEAFGAEGYPVDQVHCLIPDMMSENIILSHEATMKDLTKDDAYSYECEGKNGKSHLKQIYKKLNLVYKETTDGPRLLKKLKLSQCNNNCAGISIFLKSFHFPCRWIR